MLTSPHQAHLTSLAEDSEEGSDAVSESEGGLIQDDDSPTEASPAASASLDNPAGSRAVRSSLTAATGQAVGRQRAAAGTDGMFELDIDDDIEQGSGLNSFTARNTQRFSQHAAVTGAGLQQKGDRPAPTQGEQPAAGSNSTAAVAAGLSESPADALQPRSDAAGQSDKGSHSSQHQRSSGQQPLPDSVPAAALSATPILGALQAGAGAHPRGSQATSLAAGTPAGVDLEEIQLQDGVAHVPGDKADAGQAATDEWEEVNLARARELAVDAPTAAIPGDKVWRWNPAFCCLLMHCLLCRLAGLPLEPGGQVCKWWLVHRPECQ